MCPYQAIPDRYTGIVTYLETVDGKISFVRTLGGASFGMEFLLDETNMDVIHELAGVAEKPNTEMLIVADWVSGQHYRLIEAKEVETLEMTFTELHEGGITLLLRQDSEDEEVQGKRCSFHKYEWLEALFPSEKLGCAVKVHVIYNGERTLRNALLIGVDFEVYEDGGKLEEVPADEQAAPASPPRSSSSPPSSLADLSPAPVAVRSAPAVPLPPRPAAAPAPTTARPVASAVPPPPADLPVVVRPPVAPPPAPRRAAPPAPRQGPPTGTPGKQPPPLPKAAAPAPAPAGGEKPTLPSSGTQQAVGTNPLERNFFREGGN